MISGDNYRYYKDTNYFSIGAKNLQNFFANFPVNKYMNKYNNVYKYADRAMGKLVDQRQRCGFVEYLCRFVEIQKKRKNYSLILQ